MKSKTVKELYNKIADKYAANRAKARNDYTELPTVISLAGNVKGKHILDIGCGLGKHSERLIKKGAVVTGIDISEKMIEYAQKRCGNKGKFFVANFETVKFKPSPFDLIIASYSIIYSKNIKPLFKKFNKWLKPKGRVIFSLYHPIQYYKKVEDFDFSKTRKYWFRLDSYGVEIFNYYHPLEKYFDAIRENGFGLIKFVEPQLSRKYKGWDEDHYRLPPCIVIEIQKKL